MKYLISTLALFFSQAISAQINILLNPSFETTLSCPGGAGEWNACSSWNNVNMLPYFGMWGSPDYFHPCGSGGTAPPATFSGTCSVQSGAAMMGLVVYNMGYANYREYIAGQLTCAMQPGNTYTVSFWLSNGTGILSPWTIRNFGVHFSVAPLTQSGYQVINVVPQLEITSNIVAPNWTQYTFTITATAAWKYMTLGAFRNDNLNNVTLSWPNQGGPASAYANYFLDNIQVLAPQNPTTQVTASLTPSLGVICKGSSATLTANNANLYNWNNNLTGPVIVVQPTSTTMYVVTGVTTQSCSNKSSTASVVVNVAECTGISENDSVSFYTQPNPVTDKLTIFSNDTRSNTLSIVVLNAAGEAVYSTLREYTAGQAVTLLLDFLPAGMYFVKINGREKLIRLIKAE